MKHYFFRKDKTPNFLLSLSAKSCYSDPAACRRLKSLAFEPLESRHLLNSHPVISELLAMNDSVLVDENGDYSDWLEVHNPHSVPVNVDGWYLTDDASFLTKWEFPDVTIAVDDQLVVFASDKDRRDPLSELHTNFKLKSGGEYLALVEPDGISVAFEYAPSYPAQIADTSYGLSHDGSSTGFFALPTPGAPNLIDPISTDTDGIIISEIMYHPYHETVPLTSPGENTLEEFIEIYNNGTNTVDLTGWRFDRGIDFDFASTVILAGEYLVIAADVATFQANYPNVTNLAEGSWQGKLSNRGEEIRLVDDLNVTIDSVTYADQGDWAVRAEGPNDMGFRGWIWDAESDGGGKTLELINLEESNEYGQNWATSDSTGGTPGAANSVATFSTGPIILDVNHSPAIPSSTDSVTVTARLLDVTQGNMSATLLWRVDGQDSFDFVKMYDDGGHGDGAAGDAVYGAVLPPQADSSVVEFYVHARDGQNTHSTWPKPIKDTAAAQTVALIDRSTSLKALVPTVDTLGDLWTGGTEPFDDSSWIGGTGGIGYETAGVLPVVSDPVAYWTFDELHTGGTVAPDAYGRYSGTVVGATVTSGGQGRFGEALSFDGDNDSVSAGVISELIDVPAFTVSLWFQRAVDHAGVAASTNHAVNSVLIAQSSNTSNDNLEIGTESDAVQIYLDTVELGGATTTVNQPAAIQNNVWHHLVVTYDSNEANELKLYVDGSLVSEHSEYGGLLDNAMSPLTLGVARPESSAWGDFEGLMDDVAVWDSSLDAVHVAALFAGTTPFELAGYSNLVSLDLQAELKNQNTSAYVRIPFSVSDPVNFDGLRLQMHYDDAFVAYLNGIEIARAGFTGTPQWNSAADADRNDMEAAAGTELSIPAPWELLTDGQNMMAIQLLNFDANAARSLLLPELSGTPSLHVTNAQYQVIDALSSEVVELVGPTNSVRALVPTNDALGRTWTVDVEGFDDSSWLGGTGGVGYETMGVMPSISLPIAYWTFDELQAMGSQAPDLIHQYNAQVVGANLTTGGQGRFGEALSFDGDNDYVNAGVMKELIDTPAFAISLWFRRTVDHGGVGAETNHTVNNVLIAQSSDVSNDNLEIGTEGDAVEVYLDTVELGGATTTVKQPASLQNDEWHHLVVSYDSDKASELKIFVDGLLVSEHSEYGGLLDNALSPLTLGVARPGAESWGDFEGLIDDVSVWDTALTTSHVESLYNGTSPLDVAGYTQLVSLDLQDAWQHQSTSAYVRIPFVVEARESLEALHLHMQYDDAFVAYINGQEVARAGVTGVTQWNSVADADRPDGMALNPQSFSILNQPGLLNEGQNILAIQLLNSDASATRTIALATLEAVQNAAGPSGVPVIHQIMTAAQRSELETMSRRAQIEVATFRSNAQMNATFIAITEEGVDIRYTTGIRLRGNYSRGQIPPNNRINIPSDRPWRGISELMLNVQNMVEQLAAYNLFSVGGLPSSSAEPVLMYSNGVNLRGNSFPEYYALIETLNNEYASRHFPTDDGGNLYKGRRAEESPPGGQGAGLIYFGADPAPYVSYQKQTNKSAQDWSDVINLTFQLHHAPDTTFLQDVAEVVDIDQWLRFFAMNEFLNNEEGGLILGDESGGDEYAMYRGATDTRFQMVPVDLDEMFNASTASLLRFAGVTALNRLFRHVDVLPEYGAAVWDVANTVLTTEAITDTLLKAWGPLATESRVSTVVNFFDARRNYINGRVHAPVTFSLPSGVVPAGTQLELEASGSLFVSSSTGTIYYTIDGTDPRSPGGDISTQAIQYTGQPIPINESMRVIARSYDSGRSLTVLPTPWSGTTVADYVANPQLVVTEVQYNPHSAEPGELMSPADSFEFIEVMNVGSTPLDLDGVQFTQVDISGDMQGIRFTFGSQILGPGDRTVVVNDMAAFESRHGTGVPIAVGDDGAGGANGEYGGQLSNGGERLTLVGPTGSLLYMLDYNDGDKWPQRADGLGSSLELQDPTSDPDRPDSWNDSVERSGTPGSAGGGPVGGVVINEVMTNTPGTDVDAIEFYNPTLETQDLGGMWLSDGFDQVNDYVIPANTIISPLGYLVLDENDFGFGLNGNQGESVVLVQPGVGGNPHLFIDDVSFGAALPGESFGRLPNGTGDFYPLVATSWGAENGDPRIGPLVISEVMYRPTNPLLEYVEIYNPTPVEVDLGGWAFDGIGFDFPADVTVGPGDHVVILPFDPTLEAISSQFDTEYGVSIEDSLSSYLGPYSGQLDNDGETLTLYRAFRDSLAETTENALLVIEDQVDYDDASPWPEQPDSGGMTLHRHLVDLWGNDPNSWTSSIPTPSQYGPRRLVTHEEPLLAFGEVGRITDLTHEVQTIVLSKSYTNPVVFAQPVTSNGADTAIARVRDVQSDRFDIFLAEPSNLNGIHGVHESVGYFVFEAGTYWLSDGAYFEVGTVETSAAVGANMASPTWEQITFAHRFSRIPVVFSQVQTMAGEIYLSTRQQPANATDVRVALEPEESFGPSHGVETVGYMAILNTYGEWGGMPFITRMEGGIHSGGRRFSFSPVAFSGSPSFVASLASYVGNDNAHLRVANLDSQGIDVRVEEDTTVDTELGHIDEAIAYLAIGGSGTLPAYPTSIVDGHTQMFSLEVTTSGFMNDLDVRLDLSHHRMSDLEIYLESPAGTMVELFSNIGGNVQHTGNVTLDDEADQQLTTSVLPSAIAFQPAGMLSDFDGESWTGTWTLHVADNSLNNMAGVVANWSLAALLGPEPVGNLNHDSQLDADDIDMLFANLGSSDHAYDLNRDRTIDNADVDHLVLNVLGKRYGDADLDQQVDIADFGKIVRNYDPLGNQGFYGWAQGNFNGDDKIDIADFNHLAANFSPLGYIVASDTPVVTIQSTTESSRTNGGHAASGLTSTAPVSAVPADVEQSAPTTAEESHVVDDDFLRSSTRRRPKPNI